MLPRLFVSAKDTSLSDVEATLTGDPEGSSEGQVYCRLMYQRKSTTWAEVWRAVGVDRGIPGPAFRDVRQIAKGWELTGDGGGSCICQRREVSVILLPSKSFESSAKYAMLPSRPLRAFKTNARRLPSLRRIFLGRGDVLTCGDALSPKSLG